MLITDVIVLPIYNTKIPVFLSAFHFFVVYMLFICLAWSSGWGYSLERLLLVTDVSTTWVESSSESSEESSSDDGIHASGLGLD